MDDIAIVPLTQGKEAIIDARFSADILALKWYAKKDKGGLWYAARAETQQGKSFTIRLHRFVYTLANGPIAPGMQIDHRNGNGLDNCLKNLRMVSTRANQANQAKHRKGRLVGAHLRDSKKWEARLKVQGRQTRLGEFFTEREAHAAYLGAVRVLAALDKIRAGEE